MSNLTIFPFAFFKLQNQHKTNIKENLGGKKHHCPGYQHSIFQLCICDCIVQHDACTFYIVAIEAHTQICITLFS